MLFSPLQLSTSVTKMTVAMGQESQAYKWRNNVFNLQRCCRCVKNRAGQLVGRRDVRMKTAPSSSRSAKARHCRKTGPSVGRPSARVYPGTGLSSMDSVAAAFADGPMLRGLAVAR